MTNDIDSVSELRIHLKRRLHDEDHADVAEIAKVNTFERIKTMQTKTRELTDALIKTGSLPDKIEMDKYDHLAIDWVYSDRVEWDGSLAYLQAEKLKFRP